MIIRAYVCECQREGAELGGVNAGAITSPGAVAAGRPLWECVPQADPNILGTCSHPFLGTNRSSSWVTVLCRAH